MDLASRSATAATELRPVSGRDLRTHPDPVGSPLGRVPADDVPQAHPYSQSDDLCSQLGSPLLGPRSWPV